MSLTYLISSDISRFSTFSIFIENAAVLIVASFPSNTQPSARFSSYEQPLLNPSGALTVYTPSLSASAISSLTAAEPSFTVSTAALSGAFSPDTHLMLKVTSGSASICVNDVMLSASVLSSS